MESALIAPFRQHVETARESGSETPTVTQAGQSTQEAIEAPSGNRQPRNPLLHDPADNPAKATTSSVPTSEIAVSGKRTMPLVLRDDVQQATIPKQLVDLEPPSEATVKKDEKNAPNAFAACATTGNQRDYVKTETGFVLCEGLSFDARGWR
jgi:hypothetical protein